MVKIDFKNLEKISDYSIALMEEISSDIRKISDFSGNSTYTKLDDINKKIDFAREKGVNVDSLNKQVLEFRIVLFKRRINSKIEEINLNLNKFAFDMDDIEKEYKEFQKENNIDLGELQIQMHYLYNEVIKSKIKFMINDIKESEGTSVYSIDQIANELDIAKGKGINVDDIEEILFE